MSERTTTRHTSTTPGTGYGRVSTETMKSIVETSRKRRTFWQQLGLIGPAFVAGAWQFGPGNLTTAVQAGSGYQYTLIWVIVVSTILMIFLTDMSVRLGIKSPVSLIASIKDHLGTWVGVLAGIGIFLITLCFSVGNAVGSGLGLSMLFGGSPDHVDRHLHRRRRDAPAAAQRLPSHREGARRHRRPDGHRLRRVRLHRQPRLGRRRRGPAPHRARTDPGC